MFRISCVMFRIPCVLCLESHSCYVQDPMCYTQDPICYIQDPICIMFRIPVLTQTFETKNCYNTSLNKEARTGSAKKHMRIRNTCENLWHHTNECTKKVPVPYMLAVYIGTHLFIFFSRSYIFIFGSFFKLSLDGGPTSQAHTILQTRNYSENIGKLNEKMI